jgi:hypothetical protein
MPLTEKISSTDQYHSAKITLSNVIQIAYFSTGLIRPRPHAGATGESTSTRPFDHEEETH